MPTTLDLVPPAPPPPRGRDLPYSDGVPLESLWHRMTGDLLLACLQWHWRGREDFFAGANQFFYFDPAQAKNNDFLGPDFYVVKGVSHEPLRRSWVTWDEGGRVPNVIVELVSESTAAEDRGEKKRVYLQQLDVKEYFCFDPNGQVLEGWRKNGRRKPTPINPTTDGRLWSEELDLFLGSWTGEVYRYRDVWLRFFDANGTLIQTLSEAEAARAQQEAARAQQEAARARQEAARAQQETTRANAEAARADMEKREKDDALAELARLKAELDRLKNPPT